MIKLYKAIRGKRSKLIGEGETLHEVVEKAYEAGVLNARDELSREDLDEQIEVLVDYVRTAHQDYVITYDNFTVKEN